MIVVTVAICCVILALAWWYSRSPYPASVVEATTQGTVPTSQGLPKKSQEPATSASNGESAAPPRRAEYKRCIDEVADTKADAVQLCIVLHQENGHSEALSFDRQRSLSADGLRELIDYAKIRGLRVIVKPRIVLSNPIGGEWAGTIAPASWENWFRSYRAQLMYYIKAAQGGEADLLVVGNELVSTQRQVDQWRLLIADVRKHFNGLLTYQANWDAFKTVEFWNDLDLVGMNSFWDFADENEKQSTADQFKEKWMSIKDDILSWKKTIGKPVIFLELGWQSTAKAAYHPWDYTDESIPIDMSVQADLYEAFFEIWQGATELGGFSVYEWTTTSGPTDRGYTPHGKPAEKILRKWLAKPWSPEPKLGDSGRG